MIFKKKRIVHHLVTVLAILFTGVSGAQASELVINSMHSDPTAKAAFNALVEGFQKAHPKIKVKVNTIDHESYKVQIRTWLPHQAPDVATWFAGNRARFFIEKGLIEPIPEIWKEIRGSFSQGAHTVSAHAGKEYLLPLNSYHWGFYYRRDLFKKAGIAKAPTNWDEFLQAIDQLKAKGLIPITIGTKQAWPAAAWFDYLNMRINGYEFHMQLLSGQASYTDPKVTEAMDAWKTLILKQAFPENSPAMTWQEASALLWQGKAAMTLMGNFISSEIPQNLDGQVGFFPFPTIKTGPQFAKAEVAPTDVIFIPAKARNKADAKLFLRYAATAEAQQTYNDLNGLLAPNTQAKLSGANEFRRLGQELLAGASALSQFFDRDADPQVAKSAMDGFVEFTAFPDRQKQILKKIERVRKRVHR